MQLTHYNTNFKKQTFPIIIVCDNVTNAPNIGSLLRTSDAFGVEKLVLSGSHIPLGRKMTKTSRAAEKYVDFEIVEDTLELINQFKAKNYKVIALEITDKSQSLHTHRFNKNDKYVVIIGGENFGISEVLLELSDVVLHIDMYGQNSSMNVVQATSITLYEMTRQLLS